MLELRKYPKAELSALFGTRDTQGLKRKLERYGIVYEEAGRGNTMTFDIKEITDPFKIFCITELDFDGGTDFKKVRNFYYYFFNDEEFMAMPDEVKERRMGDAGHPLTRQTIATYTRKLVQKEYIYPYTSNFIYYFACDGKQTLTDEETYKQAWREYWIHKDLGCSSREAISMMFHDYGGYARKQPVPTENVFYKEELDFLQDLIGRSLEDEVK